MKKHIILTSAIILVAITGIILAKADVHQTFGILKGSTFVGTPTYLKDEYAKYWNRGVSGTNEMSVTLNRQEGGLYMLKTTRKIINTTSEQYIKFDRYGSGNHKVILKAIGGNVYGEYLLYSRTSQGATSIGDVI